MCRILPRRLHISLFHPFGLSVHLPSISILFNLSAASHHTSDLSHSYPCPIMPVRPSHVTVDVHLLFFQAVYINWALSQFLLFIVHGPTVRKFVPVYLPRVTCSTDAVLCNRVKGSCFMLFSSIHSSSSGPYHLLYLANTTILLPFRRIRSTAGALAREQPNSIKHGSRGPPSNLTCVIFTGLENFTSR